MVNVYKDNNDYVTIGTDKGVYLIGYGEILAFKPSPKKNDSCSLYIDKIIYNAYVKGSNEFIDKCIDYISKFCGRNIVEIETKLYNGEFVTKILQNLI